MKQHITETQPTPVISKQITDLYNWADNPRAIKKEKFEELKNRIKRFGQFKPLIVTEDGEVLGGNMRLRAYKELGINDVWVSVVSPKTQAEKIEIALTDNEEMGYYEDQALAELINKYKDDIDLTKYSVHLKQPQTLEEILKELSPDEVVEDEAPEVSSEPPISKLGEVYQLGRHRLMCGDSTKIEDVEKLMDGQKADMVFTSPPYNADAKTGDGDIFNNKVSKQMYQGEYKDKMSSEDYIELAKKVLKICFDNTVGFIFWNVSYNAKSRFEYIKQIEDYLEYLIEQICWKKSSAIPLKGSLRRAWEPIYLFSTHKNTLGTEVVESNLWEISNNNSQIENHKACFPVALPTKGIILVKNSKIVLDPFGGSGSTLIACEQTDRTCYMMELDPKYCDVIRQRYEKFINRKKTDEQ